MEIQSLAYAAGIIDGEGCIIVGHNPARFTYVARVTVVMATSGVVNWLHKHFGGRTMVDATGTFRWQIHGRDAVQFISYILPYMITKKKEAEIFMTFPFVEGKKIVQRRHPQFNEIYTARGYVFSELKRLKKAAAYL